MESLPHINAAEGVDRFNLESESGKIELARRMHDLSQQGKWEESFGLACSDPSKIKKAQNIAGKNLKDFNLRGESAVNERYIIEAREVGNASFDLAVEVEQGEVSREAALIITKLYKGTLSEDQIYAISSAFVARRRDEPLEEFEERRLQEINSLTHIDGLSEETVANIRNEVFAALSIFHRLESQATKKFDSWPMRPDGQIRRSFIDRSKILNLTIETLREVQEAHGNIEGRIKQIQERSKIPDKIESFGELLELSDLGGKIKCVSFDMFDTLVEWTSNVDERHSLMMKSALNVFKKRGIDVDTEYFERIRNEIWYAKYKDVMYPTREFKAEDAISDIVDRIVSEKGANLDQQNRSALVGEINQGFINVDSDTAIPTPGILIALKELKEKGVRVVVISNHPYNKDSVGFLLKKYGLSEYIDDVIVSSEVGFRKTGEDKDAQIFRLALDRNGLQPDQLVHVGDNQDNDCEAPKHIGIKGIRFDNAESSQKNIEYRRLIRNSVEYKNACVNTVRDYSDRLSAEYFERVRKEGTPQEMEKYAHGVYSMSREYYAPLIIKYAEHCLDKLGSQGKALNLCVGRDALASYLVQKKLIELFPDRYDKSLKDRIKYVPLSRSSALGSSPDALKKYLSGFGTDSADTINVIDNGIEGTIQNHLINLYPGKSIEGEYLQSAKFDDDKNRQKKHGFIYEQQGHWEYDKSGNKTRRFARSISGDASVDQLNVFASADFVHCQEDIWNGIFSSPGVLVDNAGNMQPANNRQKLNFVAGNPDIIPGLNEIDNYLMLKRMGLKGLLDGVRLYKRQDQLGVAPTKREVITRMADWFNKSNTSGGLEKKIFDGLARKRN
jgi:FMN phosphatase YigB (HAD superfamily)